MSKFKVDSKILVIKLNEEYQFFWWEHLISNKILVDILPYFELNLEIDLARTEISMREKLLLWLKIVNYLKIITIWALNFLDIYFYPFFWRYEEVILITQNLIQKSLITWVKYHRYCRWFWKWVINDQFDIIR